MIERKHYTDRIAEAYRHLPIVVLIGARQVGKTSIMTLYDKSEYRNTLFLNGQNGEVAELFQRYSTIESYLKIYLNEELDGLLLIDEFQFIHGISTMMKLLTDQHPSLKILCSGSSSLNILKNLEESLAGRVRLIEVLSLSFSEYLMFRDERLGRTYEKMEPTAGEALLKPFQTAYGDYLVYGGLPRVALAKEKEAKAELLNDIYQTYLFNDVRQFIRTEHYAGFSKLLRLLATQIGNLLNINELSRESGLPYNSCEDYLRLLQQMYIIKLIEPYMTNKRKVITKMKKVYFCDLGLRNIIYNSFSEMAFRVDNGAIFENDILLELWRNKRASETIQYYRTQNGTEVDFVQTGPTRSMAVECKYKHFDKPVGMATLNNFARDENIGKCYVANINLAEGIFLPGMFAERME